MFGYACTVEALILSILAYFTISKYRKVPNDDEDALFGEFGRELSPMSPRSDRNEPHNGLIDANRKHDEYAVNNNHNNNCNNTLISPSECNQKPYIPGNSPPPATLSGLALMRFPIPFV